MGWQVGHQSGSVLMDELRQKSYFDQAIPLIESWDYVDYSIWFWDWDRYGDSDLFSGYGMVRQDGKLRPVGKMMKQLMGK